MADKPQPADTKVNAEPEPPAPAAATPAQAPRRAPGHRGADARDTVAEMAQRAQEISQEAGSKIAMAMKDVINAAAGVAGFAVESARDLVQYMVRRGQMTQEEADRVIRDAEDAHRQQRKAAKEVGAAPAAPAARKTPAKSAGKAAAKSTKAAAKKTTVAKKKSATSPAPTRAKTAAKTGSAKKKH